MIICNNNDLKEVYGGSTISGTVVNGFVDLIKILHDAGKGIGSAIRRIVDKDLCPLK